LSLSGGNPWENHFSKNTTQPWRRGIKSNKTKFYDTYFDVCVRRSRYAFPINKYFAPKALLASRASSFIYADDDCCSKNHKFNDDTSEALST
jgi:hypothetical protein